MKTQKGFALIEGLLILVILGLIVGTGWYVMNSKKKTEESLANAAMSSASSAAPKKSTAPAGTTTKNNHDFLTIKEWGVKFGFADASKVTYKIEEKDGTILKVTDIKDEGCAQLGVYLFRNVSQITKGTTLAGPIKGYYYAVAGDQVDCQNYPLRDKIANELDSATVTPL